MAPEGMEQEEVLTQDSDSDTDYGTFSLDSDYDDNSKFVVNVHGLTIVYNITDTIPKYKHTFLHPLNIHGEVVAEWQSEEEWRVDEESTSDEQSEISQSSIQLDSEQPEIPQDIIQSAENPEKKPPYTPSIKHKYGNNKICVGVFVTGASFGILYKYSKTLSTAIVVFWNSLGKKIKKAKECIKQGPMRKSRTKINNQQNTKKTNKVSK